MGKLKFCANISWLYQEIPFFDRYQAAADSGFSGVEAAFPYEYSLPELIKVKEASGVEQVLINSGSAKTLGSASSSSNPQVFRDELDLAIKYANGLGCKKIHIMCGNVAENATKQQAQDTLVENLIYSSKQLQGSGITGLIEPISTYAMPQYPLNTSKEAFEIIRRVNKDNIMYQLDFFHLQLVEGDLTNMLKKNLSAIGHVQISQVPSRGEPSCPGEINYDYIFQLLEELGYSSWIGCEYKPTVSTNDSLKWFQKYVSK